MGFLNALSNRKEEERKKKEEKRRNGEGRGRRKFGGRME